jgi:hypothetical protein
VLAVGHTCSLKITTMLVKQEYKVDLINLKNAKDKEGLLKAVHETFAKEFGMFIAEKFPIAKNDEKSFHGELPEMCLNREHQYVDHYEQRLIIIPEEQLLAKIKELEGDAEELIQDKDNEDEGYLRLAKANALKWLLTS